MLETVVDNWGVNISIHAIRAKAAMLSTWVDQGGIKCSIHAYGVAGYGIQSPHCRYLSNFNPRPPRGGRLVRSACSVIAW